MEGGRGVNQFSQTYTATEDELTELMAAVHPMGGIVWRSYPDDGCVAFKVKGVTEVVRALVDVAVSYPKFARLLAGQIEITTTIDGKTLARFDDVSAIPHT